MIIFTMIIRHESRPLGAHSTLHSADGRRRWVHPRCGVAKAAEHSDPKKESGVFDAKTVE